MTITQPRDLISGFFSRHYPSKVPSEIVNAMLLASNPETYVSWEIDVNKTEFIDCPVIDPDWIYLSTGPAGPYLVKGLDFTVGTNNKITLHRFIGTSLDYKKDFFTNKILVWCGKMIPDNKVTYTDGSYLRLTQLVSEYCDSPIFTENGVVEDVASSDDFWFVVTDKEAIRLPIVNTPAVSTGDNVKAGDPVGTAWELVALNKDTTSDIALPPSLYRPTGSGYIVFRNTLVNTSVNTAQALTRVRFSLNGDTTDIDNFWDYIENNNVQNSTIANALDMRAYPFGEPAVSDIPAVVNPAKLLIDMVFNNNAYMLLTYSSKFGTNRNLKALKHYAASPYVTLWEVPGGVPSLTPYLSSF